MPLIFEKSPEKDCQIMVWKIDETADFFKDTLGKKNYEISDYISISHPQKQLEWLASRFLAKYLAESMNINYLGLIKDAYNKPYLQDSSHHLSISHTATHVAAGIHLHKPIGIDLENITERLHIIKHKFLTDIERESASDNLEKLCIFWSAKESLYKLYGKRGVHFQKELQVEPFELGDKKLTGKVLVENFNQTFKIFNYKIEEAYFTVVV